MPLLLYRNIHWRNNNTTCYDVMLAFSLSCHARCYAIVDTLLLPLLALMLPYDMPLLLPLIRECLDTLLMNNTILDADIFRYAR